jgi:hypothetical protein
VDRHDDSFEWNDRADWRSTMGSTCRRALCSALATDEVIGLCRHHRSEQEALRALYRRLGYFKLGNRDLV